MYDLKWKMSKLKFGVHQILNAFGEMSNWNLETEKCLLTNLKWKIGKCEIKI